MKDELKKELLAILHKRMCYCNLHTDDDYEDAAASILSLIAPTIEKAEKYDVLCLIKDPIQVEREYFQELVAKAEKWDKLKSLFETSCDKCFLNHICGTHGNPGAVCEDIKEALEGGKSENKP